MNKNSSKGVKNNNSLPSSFSASHKQVKCFKCGKIGHVKSMCGIKCYVCGKLGHKSKECFSNNNKNKSNTNNKAHFAEGEYSNKSKKEVNNGEPVAFCGMMHDESELEMIEWYADSGATHHYINDEKSLKNIRKFTKPRLIQLAEEGKFMEAISMGDFEVVSEVEGREIPITMKNVLCVPGLRVNLLSISTVEKAGFEVVCSDGKMVIKKNNVVYAECKRHNSLYRLIFQYNGAHANLAHNREDIELWHRRYGHLNYNSLMEIKNLNLVNGLEFGNSVDNDLCEVCIKSKQKCFPYHSRKTRTS